MSSPVSSPALHGRTRLPVGGVLTPRMERLIRFGSVGSALIIAVSAMVLSYSGLLDLALDAQVDHRLALLVPIMVDGLQFVGSLGVVYSTLSGLKSWYPWLLMLMGVSVSAWGNWQAAPNELTAQLLHASAPVILALVLEELLRVMRHKVHLHTLVWESDHAGQEHQVGHGHMPAVSVEPVTEPVVEAAEVVSSPASARDEPVDREAEGEGSEAEAQVEGQPTPPAEPAQTAPVDLVASPAAVSDATWTPREPVVPMSALRDPQTTQTAQPSQTSQAVQGAPSVGEEDRDDDGEWFPDYPADAPLKEQVKAILVAAPDMPAGRIARRLDKDPSYTRKVAREVRKELDGADTAGPVGAAAASGQAQTPASGTVHGSVADEQSTLFVTPEPGPFTTASPTIQPTGQHARGERSEGVADGTVKAAPQAPVEAAAATDGEAEDEFLDPFASPAYATR